MNTFNCTNFPDLSDLSGGVTGNNMTVMIPEAAIQSFVSQHGELQPNAMFIAVSDTTSEIVGKSDLILPVGQAAIAVWGVATIPQDGTTEQFSGFDGLSGGDEVNIYLLNGLEVYDVFDEDWITYSTNEMVALTTNTVFTKDCDLNVSTDDYNNMLTLLETLQAQLGDALANQDDGVSQSDVAAAWNAAWQSGVNSVTPEDGVSQSDVDAAWQSGADSVTPEDGVSQSDVDAVQAELDAANEDISEMQLDVDSVGVELTASQQANLGLEQDLDILQGQYNEIDAEFDSLTNDYNDLWSSNNDLQSQLDAALANQDDGVSQSVVDVLQCEIDVLNAQLDVADDDNLPQDGLGDKNLALYAAAGLGLMFFVLKKK